MIAVTSLLDQSHTDRVIELTDLLDKKFGLNEVKMTPYPHLTMLTAEIPDMEELQQYLDQASRETEPFTIRTTGLGVFPGEKPVIYIPVLRTDQLNQLHATLHRDISEMSSEMGIYYNPSMWLPHISLALGDTTPEVLGPVLTFLSNYNFNWEITLDNLTILQKCGDYYLKEDEYALGPKELMI